MTSTSGKSPSSINLSVIIPSYNPSSSVIEQTINGLNLQTLEKAKWELIIIDNNSTNKVIEQVDLSWHPNSKVIREERQGLTFSRICGFKNAAGNIIVMVDDDNILAPDYLAITLKHFAENKDLGAAGGKITGKFDGFDPEEWTKQFWGMLAIRDLGNDSIVSPASFSKEYPPCSPVGAGMALRKELTNAYILAMSKDSGITDRTGDSLSSGGDNEIVINILQQGYAVAYFPDLTMQHIIPPVRLTKAYLARLNFESTKSWVRLLLKYGIYPWKRIPVWTLGLRKMKTWFKREAWKGPSNYIIWRGNCGAYEALIK
jgi:glycosyltransferase involved in cell wall biosynthesis